MGRACSIHGREYRALVGKAEGRKPLRRHRCIWVDDVKVDLKEIRWEGVVWIHLGPSGGPL
jgi:hypothetical protein